MAGMCRFSLLQTNTDEREQKKDRFQVAVCAGVGITAWQKNVGSADSENGEASGRRVLATPTTIASYAAHTVSAATATSAAPAQSAEPTMSAIPSSSAAGETSTVPSALASLAASVACTAVKAMKSVADQAQDKEAWIPPLSDALLDHFLSIDPTSLTVDLLKQHLLAAKTSAVAVGAARGTPRPPFFEGCSPSPLAPSYASAAAADVSVGEDVGAAFASAKHRSSKGKGGKGGGGGSGGGGGGSRSSGGGSSGGGGGGGTGGGSGGSGGGGGGSGGSGGNGGGGTGGGGSGARRNCKRFHTQQRCFSRLNDAWRAEFGDDVELPRWADLLRSRIAIFDLDFDAILSAMYALSVSAEGDCYRCVPPNPGIAATALGASESAPLPLLSTPVPVRLADPSGSPFVARSSTVLPCPAVPSGSLSGLHLPSFSANLVSTVAVQDAMVTTTTPGGSSLYTLATEPPQVAASTQVSASGQVAASCSCRLLSHQTLLWHHRQGHPSLPRLRGMHSRLLVSGLPRSLPPLPPSPAPPCLPCVKGRQRASPNSSSFPPTTAPLGGEFSSNLLRHFCRGEGILKSFTLPDSPQQNGIAERRIGLVMEVARTSMIHAAASHFLWPFAVQYAAHQLNLWPRVSLPETSPTLRWTGEFYHPTSRRVFPSQDVTFDESVPFYHLFPYCSAPPPPPPLFLAPGPPTVDPLPPQGPAPSGVSQVDPLPGPAPVQVAVSSGAARGAASGGAASGGAASGGAGPRGAESEGAETGGAEPGGVQTGGAELGGAEPGGAEVEGVEPGGAALEGADFGGAEPQGTASSGGSAGASPRLSLQQLREWFVGRARLQRGATGAGGAGAAGARGAGVADGVPAGAGVTGGTAATGPGGARTRGTGAAGTGGVEGAGAGEPTESGATGAGGAGAGGAGVGGIGAGGAGVGDTRAVGVRAGGAGAVDPGGAVQPQPYFVPLLQQPASQLPAPSPYTSGLTEHHEPASRPVSPVRTARRVPRSRPPPVPGTHAMTLRPSSVPLRVPLPAPPESSLPEVPDPHSDRACAASPTVARLLATAVNDPCFASALVAELLDFAAACRRDYATALIAEPASASPPSVGGECALGKDIF
ncbi:unnamed protein product [Closterium sp. NIES-53]